MSTHERWIVYPLLFLTLGMVMRDKVWPQSHFHAQEVTAYEEVLAKKITCDKLEVKSMKTNLVQAGQVEALGVAVNNLKGQPVGRLQATVAGTGVLELYSAEGRPIVAAGADPTGKAGVMEILHSNGHPQARLLSTEFGGTLVTYDNQDNLLILGRFDHDLGLFGWTVPSNHGQILTRPWHVGPTGQPSPTTKNGEKMESEERKTESGTAEAEGTGL